MLEMSLYTLLQKNTLKSAIPTTDLKESILIRILKLKEFKDI